jgi:hypothetical protein
MQCLSCGGALEWAGNGQQARCTRCGSVFAYQGGQLVPMGPQAQAPQNPAPHNLSAGTFDMGGGQQLQVKINGKTPEGYLKDKASSMIWGWVIGGVIVLFLLLGALGLGGYIFYLSKQDSPAGAAAAKKAAAASQWDGKSTFECKGNDVLALANVKANVAGTAIKASANCQLTLTGVDITAATGIDAGGNAKVNMVGGSITATSNSVVAANAAKVDCVGTKVSGKSKASGAAKVTGAN